MQFVDANIFIRHLTQDDPVKAQACFQLFEQAKRNEVALITSESVIAEVVYVLSSKGLYNKSAGEVRALLYPLLSLSGFKLANRKRYLRALDLYVLYTIDFEDALALAQMESRDITQVYSYDRHFDRVDGIERLEP